jgi:hypothetical protein
MRQITPDEREAEVKYMAGMLKIWLDDEWSLQAPHKVGGGCKPQLLNAVDL